MSITIDLLNSNEFSCEPKVDEVASVSAGEADRIIARWNEARELEAVPHNEWVEYQRHPYFRLTTAQGVFVAQLIRAGGGGCADGRDPARNWSTLYLHYRLIARIKD